jgi:hypothetical protein
MRKLMNRIQYYTKPSACPSTAASAPPYPPSIGC